jgi:hypothetical protein
VQNNPHKYIDPSGHIAVATIAKMGTGALFDMGMQIVANYFFNSKTAGNFKESFSKVNWWQATRSGVESLFHFKSKTLTAAITGFGDVIINWMKQGKKYSCEKALKDFAVGFLSDLAARYVCKFGAKAVAKGMDKMGVSHARIKKLTGIDLSGGRKMSTIAKHGDTFGKMGTYIKNPNIKVDWKQYAGHAAERMQQRGINRKMVENIVKNGKVLSQNGGSKFAYITKKGVAVVNKDGKLITAWTSANFDNNHGRNN